MIYLEAGPGICEGNARLALTASLAVRLQLLGNICVPHVYESKIMSAAKRYWNRAYPSTYPLLKIRLPPASSPH